MINTIVSSDNTISYSGVIQYETIQTTGTYEITAYGAQGGAGGSGSTGGYGAEVGGLFTLTQGEVLEIIVGSEGSTGTPTPSAGHYTAPGGGGGSYSSYGSGGGGGGGTFVVAEGETFTPLVVAAGGGGGAGGNSHNGQAGRATSTGNYRGGFAGDNQGGAGGGGFYSGGGGGGGGYSGGGGGGGGYSGGNGGYGENLVLGHYADYYRNDAGGGEGGGSFDAGVHKIEISGENAGFGFVTIDEVSCFLQGTLIATPNGQQPIENLRPGDAVLTASGESVPVLWIGHRRFRLSARPDVAPIRFRAAALAPNIPTRDLLVSPEHAMGVDGKLVPARLLVNGSTIIRDRSMEEIIYFHVELRRHDLLLAEGAAAESWLDTGNRSAFANAPDVVDLHADFHPDTATQAWVTQSCAPLVEGGLALVVIRARLEDRAVTQGYQRGSVTTLWLTREGQHIATLQAGHSGLLRLASAAARAKDDARRLGAVIAEITLDGFTLPLEDRRLALGFHTIEFEGSRSWRWTDGQALIDLGPNDFARHIIVTVTVIAAGQAWASAA